MDESTKARIDAMSYEQMLHRWRHAPVGDPMFRGEAGRYFGERMEKRKTEVSPEEAVRASKSVGW